MSGASIVTLRLGTSLARSEGPAKDRGRPRLHQLLPFIVVGVTAGSVYGLAGTGLVLTYKTSGIFNFAHGSVAAVAVFCFYFLHVQHHMPWPIAAALSVGLLGPFMGLGLELLARTLARANQTLKVAATIGLVLVVVSIGNIWYGNVSSAVPVYLPTSTFRFLGVNVGYDKVIVIAVSLVITAGLYLFFRIVRLGVAMRAVVDDPDLVALTAQSPTVIRRWAWVIGATFAALSGLLLAPTLSLDGIILTLLVVQAFGAAAIGGFSSLPLTYLGGIVIGVLGAVSTRYTGSVSWLRGVPPSLPFIVLFLVLVFTPRSRLAERRNLPTLQLPQSWYAPPRVRVGFATFVVGILAVLPLLVGARLSVYSAALVTSILFMSLALLVRTSGQVSLCQYAFAAVGASSMAHFTHGLHLPWLAALLLAGFVAVPVGAVVAIPAIRLSGVFLALATLGFGILLEQMVYTTGLMFGPTTAGIPAPRPRLDLGPVHLGTDTGFYYVILVVTVAMAILVAAVLYGRLGRLLRALGDSSLALETHGTSVNLTKLLVFSLAAFMAAIAGALTATQYNYAVGSDFASFGSLTLLALLVLIQVGDPWCSLLAAAALQVVPAYITLGGINNYLTLLFGFSAAISPWTVARAPSMPRPIRVLAERLGGWPRPASSRKTAGSIGPRPQVAWAPFGPSLSVRAERLDGADRSRMQGLEVRALSVSYGGVIAVDEVDLSVRMRRITGLIGPNGAGKTTTFNACCGLIRPTTGSVALHGQDVSHLGPAARARAGLGRTFQRVELFNSLSVRANVELGREAVLAGGRPSRQLMAGRHDRAIITEAADEAIQLTGVGQLAGLRAGQLTIGQRRLVELACVLASPADVILLDEPCSGLDAIETDHLGHVLTQVVKQREVGILLVEHDMSIVAQTCQHVYVLDFGRPIFEGSPTEMLASSVVKAAYLGSEESPRADAPCAPATAGEEAR